MKCSVEGCRNFTVQGGLCISHGAKRRMCGKKGCHKHAKQAGMCSGHGLTRKTCSAGDCTNVAVSRGRCSRHNSWGDRARSQCRFPGCNNCVVQGGLCIAHGAKRKICGFPECNKHVKKAGMCSVHGPPRKLCEVYKCPNQAHKGGRCKSHGKEYLFSQQVALMKRKNELFQQLGKQNQEEQVSNQRDDQIPDKRKVHSIKEFWDGMKHKAPSIPNVRETNPDTVNSQSTAGLPSGQGKLNATFQSNRLNGERTGVKSFSFSMNGVSGDKAQVKQGSMKQASV